MIDNITPEQPRVAPERQANKARLLYRPDVARKNLGTYLIDERVNGIIRGKKIVEEFLDGKDLQESQQNKGSIKKIERKRDSDGNIKRTARKDLFDEEGNKEIKFVGLVRDYHEQLSKSIEQKGQLLKDHKDEFLDSLSIGILYGIHKSRLNELKSTDFPTLIESDQFKAAKKTVLLALAEESLSRMDGPGLREIDTFQRYLEKKQVPEKDLSDHELKNLFIKSLEDNPEKFLQDYFINFRFSEDVEALKNSRNVFKLGEIVANKSVEVNKQAMSKVGDVEEFLRYEDKEHGFLGKRFWGEKMDAGLEIQTVKKDLSNALHKKNGTQHRSEISLVDKGILKVHPEGGFTVEAEFFDVFSEYYQNEEGKPNRENQMVLGMLYSMRKELGVGVLTQTEVLQRAKDIIPGLQRVGNDLLTNFINNNLDEFYPELIDLFKENAKAKLLGKNILKELYEIKQEDGKDNYKKDIFAVISRNRGEVTRLLVNNRHIDGFGIGEIFGGVIKRTGSEKKVYDSKNIDKLNLQTGDENAVIKLLIDGEQIKDKGIRDRVEKTMKKTSRLWRFTQRSATKAKIAFQDKLFYSEGESPWLAPPSLATEGKSAAVGATAAISFGHMVNYVMEDPVNRGIQAGLFVAGYFVTKEGGAYIKEVRARKKELGLVKPKKRHNAQYKKELAEYKGQMKQIKREANKKFWHNKGKMLYSSGSYLLTSIGVNYLLQRVGLSGSEAPMVLAATNVAVSGLLSAGGMRSGAEFIVNSLGSKKAVDGGMELLTGNKKSVGVEHARPKSGRTNKRIEAVKNRIVKVVGEIKYVGEVMESHAEENRHLQVLERFVERKKDPNAKFSKDELVETVEFLTLMKEEEGMLLIHNPRFYEKRMIRQPDGSFIEIDNREGLGKIDETRREIIKYAQNNLPKEDYDEVVEASLDFFSDVKTIRQKVFYKRMKYLVASYGYRVTFMVMSHALQSQGGLLEKPANFIFGDATMDRQHIIEQVPTTVFHANVETPKGQEALAKEVWARAEELNNLVNLMGTSEQLSEFQPGLESHLAYYGVNQAQIELLVNNLEKNNLNTSDLMRVIYVLSSYKEGQEYLSKVQGFEGTERRNLAPMIVNIAQDPVGFMNRAMEDKENATLLLLKYPDIAEKLGIKSESLAEQLNPLVIPESVKDQMLASNSNNPIVISSVGPQIVKVGDVVAEFVDGLTSADKDSKINLLTQLNNIHSYDSSMIQQAVNHNFNSFLAESHSLVGTELTNKSINDLPINSMIYKIYQAFDENGQVVPLLNRAKEGDVNAYNQLYGLLEVKYPNVTIDHSAARDQILDSHVDTEIYDKVLNNLPGDTNLRKEEIVRRLQQEMIGLGLRPVGAPILDLTEMTDLGKDPAIFADPREALIRALSPDNSDLEMAVSLTGKTKTLFVQNDQIVGAYSSEYQVNTEYGPEDIAILKAIEGAESDNDKLTFPKIIGKNLAYVFGFLETASGTTPPAGSLIEMMTGDIGRDNAMNPEAPSALHNYDAYSPGYLAKLVIAHFRGRVPEDLLKQMGPDADLTQSIHDKDPSLIDRFCNKFETLIAEKVLVAKYGEDKVDQVFLNHVTSGTVDGIQIRGEEGMSEALFAKPFKELTLGEKFLIEALGQSPKEYLYEDNLDANGNLIPNPARAINHALHIIEEGKIGDKLDIYLPGGKEQILADLHAMDKQVKTEGWENVFEGKLHLPEEAQNFFLTREAAGVQGMTLEEMQNAGLVQSVSVTSDGTVVVLKDMAFNEVIKTSPDQFMTPGELTSEQETTAQLSAQLGGLMIDAKREGNFFVTNSGIRIPVVEAGNELVVPGLAVIEIGPDGAISQFDKTGMLSVGPQLVGSAYKPMEAFLLMKIHPEMNLGERQYAASQRYFEGQLITNSAVAIDNMGSMKLNEALANSANVPMVDMWTKIREQDPDIWFKYQDLAFKQFGIKFYELNSDGKFTEITDDPFGRNKALAVGNVFIGGATPEESGMVHIAEAYQKIGEASVAGDQAGAYVIEALNNPDHKNVHVWGQDLIDNAFNPKMGDSLIAIKTGSQQGFDAVTGESMAIRNIVAVVKISPDGKVTSTFLETTGIDAQGKPVELDWGSDLIPIAKDVASGTGVRISPEIARNGLNELFTNPNSGLNYQLGAVSTEHFYPLLKSLSSEDQYAYLREAIRTGQTKYLFVDLVGAPHDNIQSVAIHLKDATGVDKLITLNVSANLIEPTGPVVGHFSDTGSQTAIVEILTQATQSEPEKYGGLLAQLKGQGINFIPIHDYEASPALFAIHEQMEKRGMLFTGAEDTGAIMKQLGLDPKTTVFVNDELFRALNQENPNIIKEQLFAQREYLAMAAIYESSGLPGALDSLIYDKDMTSNPSYQLLKIFAETKTSQIFKPVDGERQFLIDQFQNLISNPEKAKELAPDVIIAYNLYNQMSDGIARGVPPDPVVSKNFIDALNNFDKTTKESTLLSLGIVPNQPTPSVQALTPLPSSVAQQMANATPVTAGVNLTGLFNPEGPKPNETVEVLVNNFITHPEKFDFMNGEEKATASLVMNNANLVLSIVESPEAKDLEGQGLINYINNNLPGNIKNDSVLKGYIELFSNNGRQCGTMNLIINRMLVLEDPDNFKNMGMGSVSKGPVQGWIADLVQANKENPDVQSTLSEDGLFIKKIVDDIADLNPGDTLIATAPWTGDSDVGDATKVVMKGVENGVPYVLVFGSNFNVDGRTQFRKIFSLNELIRDKDWTALKNMYPNTEIATPPEPIFGTISVAETVSVENP